MSIFSRSYDLYSDIQRSNDIVVIFGENHFEVEEKVEAIKDTLRYRQR
ncbi:DUF961 family protein [Clostridium lapidicellarium]|jgi:predicted class III extradiol MEMO1 family dioxygenase